MLGALVCLGALGAAPGREEAQELGLFERTALARIEQVYVMQRAFRPAAWKEFLPHEVPAVLHEPGGAALAAGFPEPPPGFRPLAGVRDAADRPVFRAEPGAFAPPGRSPAQVAGRWAVVSEVAAPEPVPSGLRMGRPQAESAIAAHVSDALMVHLMRARGTTRPYPVGPAAYPESPDLTALAYLQQRALLRAAQMVNVTERNIGELHRLLRQVVAVWRSRARLVGPELAALEREVELTDGLGLYARTIVLRSGVVNFEPPPIAEWDATFGGYASSPMNRILLTNEPLLHFPDGPDATWPQIALRACALGFQLDRLSADWAEKAMPGDRSFADLVAEILPLTADQEAEHLESAKKEQRYEVALRLAREDIERVRAGRRSIQDRRFPPGRSLLVVSVAPGGVSSYQDDPWTTGHAGEGKLLHPGALLLEGPGLSLAQDPGGAADRPPVLTVAGGRRDAVGKVYLALPEEASVRIGGRPAGRLRAPAPLDDERPLELSWPGLRLRVARGVLESAPDGTWKVTLP